MAVDFDKLPEVKHERIDGELYAVIEGRRYLLKNIGGMHCLSETDLIDLISRYAPEEHRAQMIEQVRSHSAAAQGSSGALQ